MRSGDMAGGFPQRLRALRERRRMSRRVLAELCGLSKNMVAQYERGEKTPTGDSLERLADFFGVTMDELWGRGRNFSNAHYSGHSPP